MLPPDNTISTKEEAFKLDEEVDSAKAENPTPTTKATETTLPTQIPITTTSTMTQTTPPVTTRMVTSTTTIRPTTTDQDRPSTRMVTSTTSIRPTTLPPPLTTIAAEKTQEIAIQTETLNRTVPTSPTNINLNLEITSPEVSSEAEEQEGAEAKPTIRSVSPLIPQEESPEQPMPKIIIAAMPPVSDTSQNQQPPMIAAQPSQLQPQPQIIVIPQPTSRPPVVAPQKAQPQPQYVIVAPQPTSPPPPLVLHQPISVPVSVNYPSPPSSLSEGSPSSIYVSQSSPPQAVIAAPSTVNAAPMSAASPSKVIVSSFPPASITVNSPPSNLPWGESYPMLSPSLFGLNPMGLLSRQIIPQSEPLNPMNTGGLSIPMIPAWPGITLPLGQQFQMPQSSALAPSPLLPSLPQGYDPLVYSSLTGMFANAIRNALVQPEPYSLAAALALGANQAQAKNQPLDILTAALTQALAQNIQQGLQPISNTKLIQALSQAISQVQSPGTGMTSNPPYPPQNQPPPQRQPAPPPPPPPQIPQPPPPNAQQPAVYVPTSVSAYPAIPYSQPSRDARSDKTSDRFSFDKVGRALAKALVKAARKIASRNAQLTTYRLKESRGRHRDRDNKHFRERSFVPSLHLHSPDLNYKTYNTATKSTGDDDMKEYFSFFRAFWRRILPPCRVLWCRR